jgi:WD40 repeat protein
MSRVLTDSGSESADRRGRQDTRSRPIRPALLTWPAGAFLVAGVTMAACLLVKRPYGERTWPRATLVNQGASVRSVAFSQDGALMAMLGGDGSVVLRDPDEIRSYRPLPRGSDPVRCLAFAPDGKVLATCGRTTAVALYELDAAGSRALHDEAGATVGAAGLAYAPDGATLAVGQQDGRITLWDVTTGRMRSALSGHIDFVASLAYAPDGETLASSGGDRCVRLWDPKTGRERFAIPGQASTVVPLSFSPDGRFLALADQVSPVVRLWMIAAGLECERAALRGTEGSVVAVAISPDGTTLVTADLRGQITCWDLATLAIRPIRLEHAGVQSLAFAPDGRTLASGGFDGTIHLWDWQPSSVPN